MIAMARRFTSKWIKLLIIFGIISISYYYLFRYEVYDLEITRGFKEHDLMEALKGDKGTGCDLPRLDPYSAEMMQYEKPILKINCPGVDWVKCHLSRCTVVQKILDEMEDIVCKYSDILYKNDDEYAIGSPVAIIGKNSYTLRRSDHVKVTCVGSHKVSETTSEGSRKKWTGYAVGFRTLVERKKPLRENLNVLFFCFDYTSRNGFIRRMPKSYEYLKKLGGTLLEGYSVLGDGSPSALFPILTGRTEFELPDVRKMAANGRSMDDIPFIFDKLKKDGYRTAYFEDVPWVGTLQYRFNGFKRMPVDHYSRAFFLDELKSYGNGWWKRIDNRYCVGATPRFKLMMNITDQFMYLDGKKFAFTFVADIAHEDADIIVAVDDDMVEFLRTLKDKGRLENTLVFIMGIHGPKFTSIPSTLQGILEERLPLMCLLVPPSLVRSRPSLLTTLQANSRVLTTPHDIYATLLDAMNFPVMLDYKVPGADLPRAMSLFQPIPSSRTCSEAGVEPHWCVCLKWLNVSDDDLIRERIADAVIEFINEQIDPVRSKCAARTLTTIVWVIRQVPNKRVLTYVSSVDEGGYFVKFADKEFKHNEYYRIKFVVSPGEGEFVASLRYLADEDTFQIDVRDISRTNAYDNVSSCISATHPHLTKFCYCYD